MCQKCDKDLEEHYAKTDFTSDEYGINGEPVPEDLLWEKYIIKVKNFWDEHEVQKKANHPPITDKD